VRGPAEATGKAVNVWRGRRGRKGWRGRNIFGEADLTINAYAGNESANLSR